MDILTGIISKIIEYTVVPVGRQVGYLIYYKSNLQSLRSQLDDLNDAKERMKHRVDEAERNCKGVEADVQNWRKKADEITQEAEKILGNEGQAKTKCFRGVCPNLVSYHQLSRESSKLVKKIEVRLLDKEKFPSVSYFAHLEEIFDTPYEDYMAFESRISIVNKIMAEFGNPGTNLVGVYGIGGVGKSTLVQEVYRLAKNEKLFDDVVLVLDAKQFPEVDKRERIQKKIAEKLDMNVQESQDMEARAKLLWNRIKNRKILVILDDVWEAINLEAMGLRPMATCKILLTSRGLVSEMRTQKVFRLEVLDEKESWSLFKKMAGDVVENDRIRKVATELAQKCGGLPVLVVTVASSLRLNSTLEEWKDTLRRFKRCDDKGLTEKARLGIEWSYNRLDAKELQPLFLLCGVIVGGGSSIYLFYLLHCAMGLGLVKNVDTLDDARNALHSLTKKLKDSCLLLDGNEDGTVRMHELIRDVAIRIASRDKHAFTRGYGDEVKEWPNRDFLKKCSTVSLMYCKIPRLLEVPWVCPELRLLMLGKAIHDSLEIPTNFFQGMKELKVLDLTGHRFPSLPSSLTILTNLQTLCLDQCELGDIALVGKLTNLKILSLIHSEVKELPKQIGQLTRLQLLDLSYCSRLVLIPNGVISSLTRLEELRMGIKSFKQWEGADGRSNASIIELKHLSELTALQIHIPDANILPTNLFSDKLERYTILIGDCWQYHGNYGTSSNMLKLKLAQSNQFDGGMKSLLNRCEDLSLDGIWVVNIISYLLHSDCAKQLKHLHVQNNDEFRSIINSISRSSHPDFPILESLSLDNLVNLESVCFGAEPWKKLQSLTLRNLPKLTSFSYKGSRPVVNTRTPTQFSGNEIGGPRKLFMNGEEVMLPNLTTLIMHQCDGLRFLFSFSIATSLVQLTYLEICRCQIMEEIVTKNGSSEENTENVFCNLKSLWLQGLPSLTKFCSGSYVEFSSLDKLFIYDCPRLGSFIFDGSKSKITIMGKENDDKNSEENLEIGTPHFLFDEKVGLPSLETLDIRGLPTVMTIWYNRLAPSSFCKLSKVRVFGCHNLINIFAPSMMGRLNALDTLEIWTCKSLQVVFKEIVAEEGAVETTPELEFVFPKVTSLSFQNLPQLRSFFPGPHVSKWPLLKQLDFSGCDKVEIFASEYSRWQERLVCTPIKQPFLLVDKVLNAMSSLTSLHLSRCDGLRFLFSCSVARSLVLLERMEIGNCEMMEEIVSTGGYNQEHNMFCSLKSLTLQHLPSLTRFCSGSYIEFLLLQKLHIEDCPRLGTFIFDGGKSENTTMDKENNDGNSKENFETVIPHFLFDEKVMLPNLTTLIIHQCDGLRFLFSFSMATSLVQLEHMKIRNCKMMEEIVTKFGSSEENTENRFCNLKSLQLQGLPSLTRFCSGSYIEFSLLEKLHIEDCPRLGTFIFEGSESEITTMGKEKDDRTSKENLETGIPHLLFDKKVLNVMPNLTRLDLYRRDGLRFLFSCSVARSFVQLEHMNIEHCEMMEEIVSTSGYNQEHNMFCNLKSLTLRRLPSLTRFCSGSYIEFSSLVELFIYACPRLGTFIFDGSESEITTMGEENDDKNSEENLETVIPYFLFDEKVGFPSLETLDIGHLHTVMTIWHNRPAPNSFCKLRTVRVWGCHNLINIFAPSMMGRLNALDTLEIWLCKSLQVVFKEIVVEEGVVETTPELEFVFPKVTSLTFKYLPQLKSFFPGLHVSKWPLLKQLEFDECGKVEIFAFEYSRLQERLDLGIVSAPIKQPFLLVDKQGNPFPNLENLSFDKNTEIWHESHGPLPAELFINLKTIRFSCAHPNSFAFLEKLHGLEQLVVDGGPWKEVFVYEGTSSGEIDAVGTTLPHIKNLCLRNMEELMHLGNDNSESIFPNLEILKVSYCRRFKNLTSSAISFHNLTTLDVKRCNGLKYLVTHSVAKCLHQLKKLKVWYCESITEIVASDGDEQDSGNHYEIAFNCLQHLELVFLPGLRGFCSSRNCTVRVPSLNNVKVSGCPTELKISPDGSLIQRVVQDQKDNK